MSSYVGLGSRYLVSALDQTGLNTGNLTTAFTSGVLNIDVASYELYHIVISSVPSGASANLYIGARKWGFTNPNSGTEWDPTQPMLLNPGQDLYFLWNIAYITPANILDQAGNPILDQAGNNIKDQGQVLASSSRPQVTCWFRYDPSLPGNH